MKDRIKQLMESKQLSQQSFAETLKISPASLSSIFNDRTKPTLNHVDAIRLHFPEVNLTWLLYGEGPMYGAQPIATVPSAAVSPAPSSPAQGASTMEPMLNFEEPSAPLPTSESVPVAPRHAQQKSVAVVEPVVKYIDRPQRQIAEIRIFYDDQTWETFVPKK